MGAVRFGAPTELLEELRKRFGISNFIETGTYLGATTEWAATRFAHVWSSELHPDSYTRATKRLERFANVRVHNESSPRFLRSILQGVTGKALFWLDAHMMPGPVSAGHDDECPVLDELRAILAWSPRDAYIFIDDARLFLEPAAYPHKADHWPAIRDVLDVLEPTRATHHVVVADDIVMVVPLEAKAFLVEFLREQGKKRKEEQRRGPTMILDGARQTIRGVARTARSLLTSTRLRRSATPRDRV